MDIFLIIFGGFFLFIVIKVLSAASKGQIKSIKEDYEADLHRISGGIAQKVAKAEWEKYGNGSIQFTVYIRKDSSIPNQSYEVFLNESLIGETKAGQYSQEFILRSVDGQNIPTVKRDDIISLKLNGEEFAKGAFYPD
jgi:hypothetical protein